MPTRTYKSYSNYDNTQRHFAFNTVGDNTYLVIGDLSQANRDYLSTVLTTQYVGFFQNDVEIAYRNILAVWDTTNGLQVDVLNKGPLVEDQEYELRFQQPATPAAADGEDGWTPVFATVADGVRRVQRVVDWTGGEGTKPATGKYVGLTGFVDAIADGVDIRGPQGIPGVGTPGSDGLSTFLSFSPVGGNTVSTPASLQKQEFEVSGYQGELANNPNLVTPGDSVDLVFGAPPAKVNQFAGTTYFRFYYVSDPVITGLQIGDNFIVTHNGTQYSYTVETISGSLSGKNIGFGSSGPNIASLVNAGDTLTFSLPGTVTAQNATYFNTANSEFRKTTDTGTTWTAVNISDAALANNANAVFISPSDADTEAEAITYLNSNYDATKVYYFYDGTAIQQVTSFTAGVVGWHEVLTAADEYIRFARALTRPAEDSDVWSIGRRFVGDDGWTPVFAVVADGERRVQRVVDWTGGSGTKPATGKYVGTGGFVDAIADGVDIRGPAGADADLGGLTVSTRGLLLATSSYLPADLPDGLVSNTWTSNPDASAYFASPDTDTTKFVTENAMLHVPYSATDIGDDIDGFWVVACRGDTEIYQVKVPWNPVSVEASSGWYIGRTPIHFGNEPDTTAADVVILFRKQRDRDYKSHFILRGYGGTDLPGSDCRVKIYLAGIFIEGGTAPPASEIIYGSKTTQYTTTNTTTSLISGKAFSDYRKLLFIVKDTSGGHQVNTFVPSENFSASGDRVRVYSTQGSAVDIDWESDTAFHLHGAYGNAALQQIIGER